MALLPKLNDMTLEGALDWIGRLIAYFEIGVGAETVDEEGVVPGAVKLWAGPGLPPAGYVLANGAVVAQADYPALYAAIGGAFNTGGEAPGNFRLPAGTAVAFGAVNLNWMVKT